MHPRRPPPRSAAPIVLFALTACATTTLPEGSGRGLVSHDSAPPAGVETFAAPRWKAGDRFVFVRGNAQRFALHVEPRGDGLALVDDATRDRQLLSAELADLGMEEANGERFVPSIAMDPADVRYHWPLWLGKRWSCHFLRKAPGQPPLPLLVSYAIEAGEDVTVAAGTFRTLRILRRASVADEGTYLERAALSWYAPAVGIEVRRLEDGILTELAEVHRQ